MLNKWLLFDIFLGQWGIEFICLVLKCSFLNVKRLAWFCDVVNYHSYATFCFDLALLHHVPLLGLFNYYIL